MVRMALLSNLTRAFLFVGVIASTTAAQAQTFVWSSSWSTLSPVNATSTTGGPVTDFQVLLNGSAPSTVTAPTNITLATETTLINNGNTNAGTFNTPINLALTLAGTTQTMALNLTGTLNGAGAGSSSLGISGFPSSLSYSAVGGTFVVDNFAATAIGTPSAPNPGAISARVTFNASTTAPEPGTVALLVLGLGGLVAVRRRKH